MKISINALLADVTVLNAKSNFGFHDWASHEKTLDRRMSVLIPKLKFLIDAQIIDGDANYVFFKNCQAHSGKAGSYDDVRIMTLPANDKDSSVYLGGFCFQTWGFVEGGNAHVFMIDDTAKNDDDVVKCIDFDDWKAMKNALKNDAELIATLRQQFNPNYVEPVVEVKEKIVTEKPVKATTKKVAAKKSTTTKKSTKSKTPVAKDVTNDVNDVVAKVKESMTDVEIIE